MLKYIQLLFGLTSYLYYTEKSKSTDITDKVVEPKNGVSLIMCTYNEEVNVEKALQSLHNQNIIKMHPEYFEFILVDSNSEDRTVEIARPYVDMIISVPRGKLTARHYGTLYANGDIIVALDADRIYPVNWLNLIIKHFNNNERVVGVTGSTIYNDFIKDYIASWYWTFKGCRMCGGASAYKKDAYFSVGGFNLDINQFDNRQMVLEEEIGFAKRLQKYGIVINDRKIMNYSLAYHIKIK